MFDFAQQQIQAALPWQKKSSPGLALDDKQPLERQRIHLLLLEDAAKGLADIAAGRVQDARTALSARKRHTQR